MPYEVSRFLLFHPAVGFFAYGIAALLSIYLFIKPRLLFKFVGDATRWLRRRKSTEEDFASASSRSWLYLAFRRPADFRPYTLAFQLMMAYVALVSIAGTLFSALAIIDDRLNDPDPVNIELINETDHFVFVRHLQYTCDEGFGEYFNDSIRVGDPRLRYQIPPGQRDQAPGVRGDEIRELDTCHRFGAINESGSILMLESLTNRELTDRDWRIVFED